MLRRSFVNIAEPASGVAPVLPLLAHAIDLRPTEWLRTSMTTFGRSVSSFLPGHFEAYARVYHPFVDGSGTPIHTSWRDIAASAGADLGDRNVFDTMRPFVPPEPYSRNGTVSRDLSSVLVEHLRPATRTPERCWFAVWEGFGGSVIPSDLEPKLLLPSRGYHVFTGPIQAALTSYDAAHWLHRSANLWWPADHAWCVATEVDLYWTYVGGTHICIESLLADPRLEVAETTPTSYA